MFALAAFSSYFTEHPSDGQLVCGSIAGVPKVFDSGQGGLLDVSLHPRVEENRQVYFIFAHGKTIANRTRVATAVLNSNRYRQMALGRIKNRLSESAESTA